MTTTGRKCTAQNRRGEPCGAYALAGSEFCYWHDPATAKGRAAARAKGGRARHGRNIGGTSNADPVTIETLDDVVDLLERAINDVLSLENSISRARAIGYLAGQTVKALEGATLSERVDALEQILRGRQT